MHLKRSRALIAPAAILAVAVTFACSGVQVDPAPQDPHAVTMNEAHRDSRCDGVTDLSPNAMFARLADDSTVRRNLDVAIVQETQRLSDNAGGEYGPLVCIIPVDKLHELTDADFDHPSGSGARVAYIWVESASTMQAYTDLGLGQAGLYCLVLKGSTANATMQAHVVRYGVAGCEPLSGSTPLAAQPLRLGDTDNPADYPAVARFVLKQNHQPGIGIKCGARWCQIFASGGPDTRAHAVAGSAEERLRRDIFGWFDQQHLALDAPGSPHGLRGRVKASIVSHERLAGYTLNELRSYPQKVAYVYVAGPSANTKYETVWNFTNQGPTTGNLIAIKLTSATEGIVFVNGVQNPNLKVTRAEHPGHYIPGVVRWKWHNADEQVWVRCGEGCCSIEET